MSRQTFILLVFGGLWLATTLSTVGRVLGEARLSDVLVFIAGGVVGVGVLVAAGLFLSARRSEFRIGGVAVSFRVDAPGASGKS